MNEPLSEDVLSRTRKGVLNILMGLALMIAASGWLIRRRAGEDLPAVDSRLHDGLLLGLIAVAVASFLVLRGARRGWLSMPLERRESRFFRSHLLAASLAALGVPVGMVYGWFVDPRLEGVAPFWVVPIAMGLLAFPRRRELEDGDGR